MIKELDQVALTIDLPEHGLRAGDLGTVVLEHGGKGYEVEFVALDGETLAIVSLSSAQVRAIGARNCPGAPYGNGLIRGQSASLVCHR